MGIGSRSAIDNVGCKSWLGMTVVVLLARVTIRIVKFCRYTVLNISNLQWCEKDTHIFDKIILGMVSARHFRFFKHEISVIRLRLGRRRVDEKGAREQPQETFRWTTHRTTLASFALIKV